MDLTPLLSLIFLAFIVGLVFLIKSFYNQHLKGWHNMFTLVGGGDFPRWVWDWSHQKIQGGWTGGIIRGKHFLYRVQVEHDQAGNWGITRIDRKLKSSWSEVNRS